MTNKKFLLGHGERLTGTAAVRRGGSTKNPPYGAARAVDRFSSFLRKISSTLNDLPADACPADKAVVSLTLHPRFISKSDFPSELLASAHLRAVGGKSHFVIPEAWGIEKHPKGAVTDILYVAGKRSDLKRLADEVGTWNPESAAIQQLQYIENLHVPTREERIKQRQEDAESGVYEVVLHSEGSPEVLDAFYEFAKHRNAIPTPDRVRFAGGVVFVPVEADSKIIEEIADFSFIRAIRQMPLLRTFRPPVLRSDFAPLPELPSDGATLGNTSVAIFDGGLPANSPLMPWVNYIEPAGIGAPIDDALAHGEQVTSAFLFGHMTPDSVVTTPYSRVDHIRVIDEQTEAGNPYELYDVLDRILAQLDGVAEPYQFVNLSLGPNLPIEDDEITAWTAELDKRAAHGKILITCAAGNSGEQDAKARLNRIQPPSDGVNLLAVGACTSLDKGWTRCSYSSVGPGRTPGVAKPDGVAFGGAFDRPFGVVSSATGGGLSGTQGTSFAAPFALRTAAGVHAASKGQLQPLAVRALLVHTAEENEHSPQEEIGWGRFIADPIEAMSCSDTDVTVVYQGYLPLGEYLRAPIPLPPTPLEGMVDISATLVIAPEVDPAFAHAYTRAGLEVVFRPNNAKIRQAGVYATSETFFSTKTLYKAAEYELRADGHKWEPCLKATRRKRGSTLVEPCFDIYYHHRNEGQAEREPRPLPYALVVTVKAPRMLDLYEATLDAYSDILVPIEPVLDIPVSV